MVKPIMMDNKQICSHCCNEDARYDFDGEKLCRPCAQSLLEAMKEEFHKTNDTALSWKIDDLWNILTFDKDSWGPNEFHWEDESWLDEEEEKQDAV